MDGDLVFQKNYRCTSRMLSCCGQTNWTHVGIILFFKEDGVYEPFLVDSTTNYNHESDHILQKVFSGVRCMRLGEALKKVKEYSIVSMNLTPSQLTICKAATKSLYARPYDWLSILKSKICPTFFRSKVAYTCTEFIIHLLATADVLGETSMDEATTPDEMLRICRERTSPGHSDNGVETLGVMSEVVVNEDLPPESMWGILFICCVPRKYDLDVEEKRKLSGFFGNSNLNVDIPL